MEGNIYNNEFIESKKDMKEFIFLMVKRHPKLMCGSVVRRWYSCLREEKILKVEVHEKRLREKREKEEEIKLRQQREIDRLEIEEAERHVQEELVKKQKIELKTKYAAEYNITSTREEFISLMGKEYSHLKKSTAVRYYSRLKKQFGEQKKIIPISVKNKILIDADKKSEPLFNNLLKTEPSALKMLRWGDIKKYTNVSKIDRDYLLRYGYTTFEINWLIDEGEFKEVNKYLKQKQEDDQVYM